MPVLSLFGLVLFPFATAALLAPEAWHLLHGVLPYPFRQYVDRCLMVSALLGLWIFWKGLGIRSLGEIGVRLPPTAWPAKKRYLLSFSPQSFFAEYAPFLLGLATAGAGLGLAILFGGRVRACSIDFPTVLGIFGGAVAVAVGEELLFRGVVQRVLEKRFGATTAIVAGSLLFALLHYLKVPAAFNPIPPGPGDGLRAVGLAFTPFAGLGWLQPRFGLLIAVGLVLALFRHRTGSLAPSIGLHAGWVTAARIGNHLTLGYPSHWAGGDFSSNPLSFLLVALAALAVWKWPTSSSTPGRG